MPYKAYQEELAELRLLIGSNPQAAVKASPILAEKVKTIDDVALTSDVFHTAGLSFHEVRRYEDALYWYAQALELRRLSGDKKAQAITLNNIGLVYHDTDRFQDSIPYYTESIKLKLELKDYKSITASYTNLGASYRRLSEYKKAMEVYYKSLKITEGQGDDLRSAMTYQNMGVIYINRGDNHRALELYKKARKLQAGSNEKKALIQLDNNIGVVLHELKKYAEALHYFEECLLNSIAINYHSGILAATNNIGLSLKFLNRLDEALLNFEKCLQLATDANELSDQCTAIINIGQINILLHKHKEAGMYLKRALLLSRKLGSKNNEAEICMQLSGLYEVMKKPERALHYYKQYNKLKSAINNTESTAQINRLQVQYESIKKEEQLQKSKLLQIESELKALRAQMDPHFIFNALSSMRKELLEGNIDKADQYIVRFSRLLRLILDTTRTPSVKLSENIELLHLYIQIEQSRQADRFTYRIQVAKNIAPDSIYVPGMVLQPLVENAIVHGLFHKQDGKGKLYIGISRAGGVLKIKVTDNGVGRKKSTAKKTEGHISHATDIIRETLSLIWNDKTKDKYFRIKDKVNLKGEPVGTEFVVLLPFRNI